MIKLLIVDDFEPDRSEIAGYVQEFAQELDIEIVGECDDGITAVEALPALRPDIILCDIQMPYMDGFALARYTGEHFPQIRFVFLSLFGDVGHLKSAIDLECDGYIIKPVDPSELKSCLKKQISGTAERRRLSSEYTELRRMVTENAPSIVGGFIRDILTGAQPASGDTDDALKYFGINIPWDKVWLCLTQTDNFSAINAAGMEARQLTIMNINSLIGDALAGFQIPLFRINDIHTAFFYPLTGQDTDVCFLNLLHAAENVLAAVRRGGYSVTAAISGLSHSPADIPALYEQCQNSLRYKYTLGKGRIILPGEIPGAGSRVDFNALQKELRFALNDTASSAEELAGRLFRRLPEGERSLADGYGAALLVFIKLYLRESGTSYTEVFGRDDGFEQLAKMETADDTKRWFAEVLEAVRTHLSNRNQWLRQDMAQKIKQYIEQQPFSHLNLESIAAHFFYSVNYINSLFKRECGQTITDYLAERKMEKAKKLLVATGQPVAVIASELGFTHISYFNYVFKRYCGKTPKEYREGCVLKDD